MRNTNQTLRELSEITGATKRVIDFLAGYPVIFNDAMRSSRTYMDEGLSMYLAQEITLCSRVAMYFKSISQSELDKVNWREVNFHASEVIAKAAGTYNR